METLTPAGTAKRGHVSTIQKSFLAPQLRLLLNFLGVVLLPGFINIEFQLAQYAAGLVQQVAIAVVVLIPALEFHRHRKLVGWSIRPIPSALSRKDLRSS
jgi:hypothetical protein